MAAALVCIHAQGIQHNDLKPDNIVISETPAERHAVLIDFCIGLHAHDDDANDDVKGGRGADHLAELVSPGWHQPFAPMRVCSTTAPISNYILPGPSFCDIAFAAHPFIRLYVLEERGGWSNNGDGGTPRLAGSMWG
ncbi:hypothetical protein QBC39DRAFT_368800 [Podospora conica]|nr:hypothetical protein QBC39DRAFT_368800 [Schizothecium conicum]